jgi:hypothetical protein
LKFKYLVIMRNLVKLIGTDYFFGDRSIDIYLLVNKLSYNKTKIVYVYNYNCYHFRLFTNTIDMVQFFNTWDREYALDFFTLDSVIDYLENLPF